MPRPKKEKNPNANPVGRPRKEINIPQLIAACQIQCTAVECAALFDCTEDTLDARLKEEGYENFSEFYKTHASNGRASLRRMQWKSAQDGNATMQIWLGKQMLGQADKQEHEHKLSADTAALLDARLRRAQSA